MFISKISKKHLREAWNARKNRAELIAAKLTRRDLLKMGLLTSAGMLVLKNGLSARAPSKALASEHCYPSPEPLTPFVQEMPRMRLKPPLLPSEWLGPPPSKEPVDGEARNCDHQRYDEFLPARLYQTHVKPVPECTARFHPALPYAKPEKVWGYDGMVPGPLYYARYGEPVYNRVWNDLPMQNGGFGHHQVAIHLHNAHSPTESDGYPMDYFPRYPGDNTDNSCVRPGGKFYDYHYASMLAGTDAFAPGEGLPESLKSHWPAGMRGDFRETLSTLWYHDHTHGFTAQNVYKGLAGMYNLYGPLDSGNEEDTSPLALKLPAGPMVIDESGAERGYEFDVNIMIGDKTFDQDGQLFFDLFNFDGILGDHVTVNGVVQPYFRVKRRKYRFRIINAGPSRFYEFFLGNANNTRTWPFVVISNDGNLTERPLTMLSFRMSPSERRDIIVDFSRVPENIDRIYLENRLSMLNNSQSPGAGPMESPGGIFPPGHPAIQRILEFRLEGGVVEDPSCIPNQLIPLPDRSNIPIRTERNWHFDMENGLWNINNSIFDPGVAYASPVKGAAEIWRFSGMRGWSHPVHVHFEEGQTLSRSQAYPLRSRPVPLEERIGRKDIWRLEESEVIEVFIQFRDFIGRHAIHCHNVVHEDHEMMLRFDIVDP